jgi:hypothetical protein
MDNKDKLPSFNLGDFVENAPEQKIIEKQTIIHDPLLFSNNPGSYEDLHKKTKGKFLMVI